MALMSQRQKEPVGCQPRTRISQASLSQIQFLKNFISQYLRS
jgi:hypothetical protein